MMVNQGFQATTAGIQVQVRVSYLADRSSPQAGLYFWAYHVTITNHGKVTVQLLRRTWHITDETGHTQMVHGEGVVGEQPILDPGESFQYTSGTPLATASGFMTGKYHMVTAGSGKAFDVAIPAFSLDSPHQSTKLH